MLGFSSAIAARGTPSAWDALIVDEAKRDPHIVSLIKAVIAHESQWDPRAVNLADPSYGLMQVLYGAGGPYPAMTVQQLLDPATNIKLGSDFLLYQLGRYPTLLEDAVAAYNSGAARRNAAGQYVNSKGSTIVQTYVDDVMAYFDWYQANDRLVAQLTAEAFPELATSGPPAPAPETDVSMTVSGGGADVAPDFPTESVAIAGGGLLVLGVIAAVVYATK